MHKPLIFLLEYKRFMAILSAIYTRKRWSKTRKVLSYGIR